MRALRAIATGVLLLGFAVNASGAGCYPESDFRCVMNEDCPGMEGICEANSYCSFPDETCPTGRRWHDRATESLAGNCIDPAADTLGRHGDRHGHGHGLDGQLGG